MDFISRPIGSIHVQGGVVYVDVLPEVIPALMGLEEFERIHLIWWFDGRDTPEDRQKTQVYSKHHQRRMGVFATRTPHRPNPIALDTVRVLWVDHRIGRVRIDRTDAKDGTPLLDIKPYEVETDG